MSIDDDNTFSAPKRTSATNQPEHDPLFEPEKKPFQFKLPKGAKIAGAVIGGLFVLLIVAGIALPFLIDFQALRAKGIEEVKKATGFDVTLDDKIDFLLMPFPQVTVHNLVVRHPTDDPDAPLLKAKDVTVDISVAGLLAKRIDLPQVAFNDAVVNLHAFANGTNNWSPQAATGTPAAKIDTVAGTTPPDVAADQTAQAVVTDTPSDARVAPAPAAAFSLDTIKLTDTTINYIPAAGTAMDIRADEGKVALSGFDGPFDVTLKGSAFQNKMPVDLKASLGELTQSGAAKPVPVTLSFKTDTGHIDLDGTAAMGEVPQYAGKVDVDFDNLAQFMLAMNPKSAAPPVKKISLKSDDVQASAKAIRIKGGQVSVDEASGPLDLTLNGLGSDTLSGDITTKLNIANLKMAKGFKELDLQGQFSKQGETTKIAPLNLTLDGQNVQGSVAMAGSNVAVNLTSPKLDLTPILKTFNVQNIPDLVLTGTALDASMAGQTLKVNSLSVKDVRGMSLAASGVVADLAKGEGAQANISLSSSNLLKSLQQLPDVKIPPEAQTFLNGPGKAEGSYSGSFASGNVVAKIVAMGGSAGVKTTVADLTGTPKTGPLTFTLAHPNTNALLAVLAPGTKLGTAFDGPMAIEAGAAQSGETWNISNLKAKLGGTTLNGNLAIKTGANMNVSGALTTGAIDIAKWFAGKETGATKTSAREQGRSPLLQLAAATTGSAGRWSTAPIDVTWMSKLGLDLTLNAAQITSTPWVIDKPSLKVTLSGGTLTLKDVSGGFMGGTINADASVASSGGLIAAKGTMKATNVNLGSLTQALVKTDKTVSGIGNLDLSVTSSGTSPNALIRSLGGSGTLKGQNLVINGLNIESMVNAVNAVEDDNWANALGLVNTSFNNGSSKFDDATIPLTIASGVLTWPETTLKNPRAEVLTKGRLDFPAWTVDIANRVVIATSEGRRIDALQIATTGSLDNPQTKTDSSAITSKVKDRAAKLINKKAPENLKKILNPLLGIETPAAVTPTETAPAAATTTPEPAAAKTVAPVQEAPVVAPAAEAPVTSTFLPASGCSQLAGATLSPTVFQGSKRASWNIRRMPWSAGRRVSKAWPSMWIWPCDGASRPANRRSKVLLPQPLRPTMATKAPGATSRSMSLSTWRAPKRWARCRSCTATPGGVSVCGVDRSVPGRVWMLLMGGLLGGGWAV